MPVIYKIYKKMELRSVLLSTLIIVALLVNANIANKVGMLDTLPGWQIDAIPAALSSQIYGHPSNYTQLKVVKNTFYENLKSTHIQDVDRAIHAAMSLTLEKKNSDYSLLGTDDKGVIHFVELSFKIFGFSAISLYKMYFCLVALSIIGLLIVYWRVYPVFLVILSIILVHALLLTSVALNPQLTSILALRVMPVAGIIASFHLILATISPRTSWKAAFIMILQATIVLLLVHIRFSAIWEVLAVCLALMVVFIKLSSRSHIRVCVYDAIFMIAPTVILLGGFFVMQALERQSMAVEYARGEQIVGHVFWHSLFSGLALEPFLSKELQIKLDDVSVIAATGKYLINNGRRNDWIKLGGTSESFSKIQYAAYDLAVRDMWFDVCFKNLGYCLKAMIWDKPNALMWNIAWLTGITSHIPTPDKLDTTVYNQLSSVKEQLEAQFNQQNTLLYYLDLFLIMIAMSISRISKEHNDSTILLSTAILLIGSLLPSLLAYPIPHAIAEPTILSIVFVVLLSFKLLSSITAFQIRRMHIINDREQ